MARLFDQNIFDPTVFDVGALWSNDALALGGWTDSAPNAGTWAVTAPPLPAMTNMDQASGSWTVQSPATGDWNQA